MGWQRGINCWELEKHLNSITNFIRQRCAGKKAKQTWSGKIIYLGEGFYVMVLFEE